MAEVKAREWYLINNPSNGWQARVNKPQAPSVHVIEAAPVLAELAALKKQIAELKADLDAIYRANMGG